MEVNYDATMVDDVVGRGGQLGMCVISCNPPSPHLPCPPDLLIWQHLVMMMIDCSWGSMVLAPLKMLGKHSG